MIAEKHKGIVNILINTDNRTLPYLQAALLIYVIMLTFPPLIIDTRSDVDYSWYVGLHKAAEQGLIYGRDIVFTYGPLGFLTVPIFINKTLWVYSALYTLVIYALTVFGCSLFIRKMKANLVNTIIFVMIFTAVFRCILNWRYGRDFELTFSVFIFTYLYIARKKNLIWLSALAFFYSVLPFIKFSAALAGLITGAAFLCILIFDKRGKEAFIFLIACLVSFVVLGLLFIGQLNAIFTYLYGCWQISSGYNDAMVLSLKIKLQPLFFALMLFVWISYAGLLFYCAIKKMRKHVIFLILGFGTLFLNYKMGYTRQDFEHLICFYSMWVFVFGLYFLLSFADTKFIRYFVLLFISIMLYECYADSVWWNIPIFRNLYKFDSIADRQSLQLCFNLLRGTGTDDRLRLVKIKTYLMQYFPLKAETVGMLSGHTMDVFPSEITITEAYGFKWDPRPVFQSYSAYTEYLDTLNAKHFSSDSAPQYVLYALHTVDDRYAIFDEPATFRTLLQKYKPCAVDGNFIVLRQTPSPDTITEKYLGRADVGFNKLILLPRVDNELLFMKIHIEYSLTGLITRLLYKPQNVFFGFFDEKKHFIDKPRRLIFTNSNDGLFVGRYIANQNDLLEIWNGNIQQNIAGILLHTDCPAFFKDKITLRFFTIPITKQSGGK